MTLIIALLFGLQVIIFFILLVYVIMKRSDERKGENFEKRDN